MLSEVYKRTKEYREKQRREKISITMKGRILTKKHRKNLSEASIKRYENPKEIEKHKKAMNRPGVIKKLSEIAKKLWQNPEYKEKNKGFTGHKHTEKFKNNQGEITKRQWKKGQFDDVFQSPTQPEKEIMRILENLKLDYIFQFRPDGYSRVYDFYILEMNLLIEYDSKYWHRNTQESDAEKTRYAKDNDYKLLRINEKNLSDFKNIIKNSII